MSIILILAEAIQSSVRKNQAIFKEWVEQEGSQERVWQEFYAYMIRNMQS